ncbi:hypothetical protein ACFPES_32155 [Paenibacillus sp. GCM10023248]|uniref:hypothetical protein n=1 Tax=Bacillales TaxID=1385 RepID=UPI002378A592|nr:MULTISPECIES: hypothetical protein [Bacillales]MDD9271696.1 hypothetical protein [Paenibacillus sp. MAHUQ-63]MDR6884587.1 hypothetical protein [Bacillus sp. 3255]
MQLKFKIAIGVSIAGYVASLITGHYVPDALNLLVPTIFAIGSLYVLSLQAAAQQRKSRLNAAGESATELPAAAQGSKQEPVATVEPVRESDPFWDPIAEYIHVLEEMIISEGQKHALDNEIVEKALSLLSRVGRLIPQLKELNDANMNYNIQRLIFKDLNGAINPFLKLGGEAKRLNRRLLLTGIKDIDSKLSSYVETIEQKDLIELQTRMELIQQRYRSTD